MATSTSAHIVAAARHVTIDDDAVRALAQELMAAGGVTALQQQQSGMGWSNCGWHYSADAAASGPLTCQFVFVLDALNFCFWPTPGLEYEHLASGLARALEADPRALSAAVLSAATPALLASWAPGFALPQMAERVSKVRELGAVLGAHFGGLASNMVQAAGGSAVNLIRLITALLPGFRDEAVYRGSQVFLYKRAQIVVADLWAAYGCRGADQLFGFRDMAELTMFADYRVPQVLAHAGALVYAPALRQRIESLQELPAGGEEEVEIRAATVQAVERVAEAMKALGAPLLSVELDWLLWHRGEASKDTIAPHHRTLSIFY
ncbi:hypothetical protein JKP88DRAFT_269044 [Tribonema minus]|uniref:Queuosine 5'-phosphate N-glycosylase/hydrolase n=1 Tax=Tribonema minus TaxID=303371 RepID=A0A836CCJ7_9STRA|nr:hypothetical protein JKP88DRAFT_269044 [Tribonema minus]